MPDPTDRPSPSRPSVPSTPAPPLGTVLEYPLMRAIFGRRSRRFGLGMEIPSGPLAFRSEADPLPLSEAEQSLLVSVGTGVSGWSFGIPHGPARPEGHAAHSVRFTGRTAPTAAGIGTPVLFFTDDAGIWVTNTRDVEPSGIREAMDAQEDLQRMNALCREHTRRISNSRLDLPSEPGHMLEPNLWWANASGSTLFMPVGDASEEMLGILSILVENGYVVTDTEAGRPAGDLAPFIRSGLLDEEKVFPLAFLENTTRQAICAETSFMAHNMVLVMQAMGLGGLYFSGMNELSVFGATLGGDRSDEGVDRGEEDVAASDSGSSPGLQGLGFRFVEDEDSLAPNPVGLDGVYEGLCPPYHPDMRAAVEAFMDRKLGPGGAYDPGSRGPWKDTARVKRSVRPYDEEIVDCLAEIAEYVHRKHGKFPGTVPTMMLPGFVQAHHIDKEYYDTHLREGAYLQTHAEHMARWHSESGDG